MVDRWPRFKGRMVSQTPCSGNLSTRPEKRRGPPAPACIDIDDQRSLSTSAHTGGIAKTPE